MDIQISNMEGALVDGDSTAIFTFDDLPGEPWLRVCAGGDLNRPYFDALLATQTKNRKRAQKSALSAKALDKNRQTDRRLFPEFMDGGEMGGWMQRVDGKHVPLEYSPEAFEAIIQGLPDDLFDKLRAFCNEPGNFRDMEDLPDHEDVLETAGN